MMRSAAVLAVLVGIAVLATAPAAPAAINPKTMVPGVFPASGFLVTPQTQVRRFPDPHSRVVVMLHQFRTDFRPEVVLAIGGVKRGKDGHPWYHVRLQLRPNGSTGWIQARVVSLNTAKNRILVQLGARRISIYHGNHIVLSAKVAVGAPGRETPVGHYYVTARFVPDNPFLGVFAVETSAYSRLTDWPGGGKVGIHGTSAPQLLGQAVSHGCVRASNATALILKRYAALGTPIDITA